MLGGSFVLESASWVQAFRQVRRESARERVGFLTWMRTTDAPAVKSVFFEDTAALTGLLLAFGGVGLHQLTGSSAWDGLASVLIGLLLTGVAFILGVVSCAA